MADKIIYNGKVFKLGTKVVGQNFTGGIYKVLNGMTGKVICVELTPYNKIGVQFDTFFRSGHSCDGYGESGYCRYFGTPGYEWSDTECFDNLKVLNDDPQKEFDF